MDSREMPEAPGDDPVLLSLYERVEEITGIRMSAEQLAQLKKHLEDPSRRDATPGVASGVASGHGILEGREELLRLVPYFTVNETYFFREEVHFRLLFRHLLPLLARLGRPIRICSAATSSGCEAYSIAMAVDFYCRGRQLRTGESLAWGLDAFDLNPEMIDAARRGLYGSNALREDGSQWRPVMDLYLKPGGANFEVAGILRDKVHFFVHNLMEDLAGTYDIIFFRNALIYFSPENRRRILGTLLKTLREGGVLIVGVSETSSVDEGELRMFHRMGAFYFVREAPRPREMELRELQEARKVPEDTVPPILQRGPVLGVEPAVPAAPQAGLALRGVPAPRTEPGSGSVPAGPPAPVAAGPGDRRLLPEALVPEIAGILEQDEGKANAARVLGALEAGEGDLSFAGLAAAALSLMNGGDLPSAGMVISSLEKRGASPVVAFLRGEFCYQGAEFSTAEAKYQEAAAAENGFWPALYRAASLAEGGNVTRYQYRLKKALESMERGAGRGYEVFIGGFSPDYYRRILEKKLVPKV